MIEKWTLRRFKSVYESTSLDMAPLTVFSGVNNSGKSTVLQSILLTAQTIQSPVQQRTITLNGHLVKLGTFNDVVSNGHENEEILIGFTLGRLAQLDTANRPFSSRRFLMTRRRRMSEMILSANCVFTFSAQGAVERKEILQLQPSLETTSIRVDLRELASGAELEIRKSKLSLEERLKLLQLSEVSGEFASALDYEIFERIPEPADFEKVSASPEFAPRMSTIVGASMLHFLPQTILFRFDEVEEHVTELVKAFTTPAEVAFGELDEGHLQYLTPELEKLVLQCSRDVISQQTFPAGVSLRFQKILQELSEHFDLEAFENFRDSLPAAYRAGITQCLAEKSDALKAAARAGRAPNYRARFGTLPAVIDVAVEHVTNFFATFVKYLAPLRDEPKPVYPLSAATDPRDVGLRGEHTAAVLEVNRNRAVEYVSVQQFSKSPSAAVPKPETLINAVLEWLRYMGVVEDVRTFDKGKLGHELQVSTGRNSSLRDLTHVGVGVSQVLPIVVMALLADRGSTLIFEQPELHLHPRVQTRLADFFLSMTLLGKQCIVETHSEHFVNRLRHRIAASPGKEGTDNIRIYFVEAENGRSKYSSIDVNEFGAIKHWPKGFFDEGEELAAAILEASLDKKQK